MLSRVVFVRSRAKEYLGCAKKAYWVVNETGIALNALDSGLLGLVITAGITTYLRRSQRAARRSTGFRVSARSR